MTLRLKIILPIVLPGALLLLCLQLLVMPAHHQVLEDEFVKAVDSHLKSVAESVSPLLSGHQLDTIYENLDTLKSENPDWIYISLIDEDGRSVYPLHTSTPPSPQHGINRFEKPLHYMDSHIGALVVYVDFNARLESMQFLDRIIMLTFFTIIFSFVIISWIVLERFVRKPVFELSHAARKMALGDFDVSIQAKAEDEIGSLVESFTTMRDSIKNYQSQIIRQFESLENLSYAINQSPIAIAIADAHGQIEFSNPAYNRLKGVHQEADKGHTLFDALSFVLKPEIKREMEQSLSSGKQWSGHISVNIDGTGNVYESISLFPIHDDKGIIRNYLEIRQDITEQKMAEDTILKQSILIKDTIESLTHPFFLIDAKTYTVKLANSACGFGALSEDSKCFRLTHKQDSPCSGVDHPCTLSEVMRTRKPVVLQHTHYDETDSFKYFEVYGYPIFDEKGEVSAAIEYDIDITDRKRLEQLFLQAQKMEAIGRLAGGVAHDFNNLLTVILGYGEIISSEIPDESPQSYKMKCIMEAGNRAAALTAQLLAFSRKQILQMKVTSLNSVVESILKILKRVIGEDVTIMTKTASTLRIKADPLQIEQILLNLAVNSRDAMPSGGRISIETADVELDEEYTKFHPGVEHGLYSALIFADNGEGMTPEVREKIFEPFFTTKGVLGTGLGLATVYGIVKQHGGHIYVYSEPKIGTTFKIYLPATSEGEQVERPTKKPIEMSGTERVLIVDDDQSIRELIQDILSPLGYQVELAAGGKSALERIKRSPHDFDLLLTDIVMPGLSGQDLWYAVREIRPDLKVIFMSGYTDDEIARHGMLQAGVNFIQKPLTPSVLLSQVREVLDHEPNTVT